ncbi:molecular chaperone HtpG [Phaeodactylibacter xiamenensis]|jgi:molecular chaperone HtpG|uniref:Chaperone protein HtpG n=1 Tax=Phaeodactylibacter xiamenensis TaxID=1524460 RepID=A0A098S8K5_9BACT|nr:molecular chaperone HtpG [Phaeodactylibacter xiamenensis]KGE88455.1 molecular chaperone Hsp90 [Phaeodactylibacter xiamenensis]MCR9053144.1 molecular chaperone HtpG [bacterium]
MQKGNISVQTENIFPIIKKFLYSDHEIFLRELVSNAVDATNKLRTLAKRGEVKGDIGDTTIEILLDADAQTLTIRDKGIGMTADEVQKYLNQVAFSSASEFLEKYKDDASIIGHFGLGFYSAFMVSSKVEVKTLSYQEGAQGVTWTCEGNPEYTLEENDKDFRGTDVILHINDEDKEFLENHRIQQLLDKYCKFLPVEIKFGTRTETVTEGEGDDAEEKQVEVDNIINNPSPAWRKQPADLTDEDYKAFYNELYPFSTPPMFWIHLNIDYPFNLTGILYFPKLGNNFEVQKNKIQLYSNQVYVTDDVKDIVPEFLTMLHGVIDSPDIPLNVSRSYLQSDSNVKKITGYITKKVADKLADLYKKERDNFISKWDDLGVFIKYGMISDEKFYDRALPFTLVKSLDGTFTPIDEYKEKVKEQQTDKYDKIVMLYTHAPDQHNTFTEAAKNKGYDVLIFDNVIDNHFMQHLEQKLGDVTFVRVDSDTVDNLVQKDEATESVLNEDEQNTVKGVFEKIVTDKGSSVITKALSPEDQPVTITRPEFMRRMKEMQSLQGMSFGDFPDSVNVVVNTNHPLVAQKLLKEEDEGKQQEVADYLYKLAMLNQQMLKGADLTAFINKSLDFLK